MIAFYHADPWKRPASASFPICRAMIGSGCGRRSSAGLYHSRLCNLSHPRLQILTVGELLGGRNVDMPPIRQVNATFRKAPKAQQQANQELLPLGG